MSFTIRPAVHHDMQPVLMLIQELAAFEKEPDAVVITLSELEQDFKANLFQCIVAENDKNEILGMALFYNRYSTWKGKTIHLEDLIVKQQCRGTGIGKALLDGVIAQAKELHIRRVEWAVLDWNTPAIIFYEKVGAQIMKNWYVVQMDENGIKKYK